MIYCIRLYIVTRFSSRFFNKGIQYYNQEQLACKILFGKLIIILTEKVNKCQITFIMVILFNFKIVIQIQIHIYIHTLIVHAILTVFLYNYIIPHCLSNVLIK